MIAIIINVAVDPYGVWRIAQFDGFNRVKNHTRIDITEEFPHFRSHNHINLVLGSSSVGSLYPGILVNYVNGAIYKLWVAGPPILTLYNILQELIPDYKIDNLFLGIDFVSFNPAILRTLNEKMDQQVDNSNKVAFETLMKTLVSYDTLKRSLSTVKDNMKSSVSELPRELRIMGSLSDKDRIIRSLQIFVNNEHLYNSEEFKDPDSISQNMEHLRKMVGVCKENNIKIRLFITPVHSEHFDLIYKMGLGNTFEKWKRDLAKISEFYDFTGHSPITADAGWWIDSVHMIPEGGNYVFERIYNQSGIKDQDSFGALVTSSNIESHLKSLRNK